MIYQQRSASAVDDTNRAGLERWLVALIAEVDAEPQPLRPTVQALADLIDQEPDLYLLAEGMFRETPRDPLDRAALSDAARARGPGHLWQLLNAVLSRAPGFDTESVASLVPIYSLLNWPLCTPSGGRLFVDPRVNAAMKPILDEWGAFLSSEASSYVLTDADGGWFSAPALAKMVDFAETYVCDPDAPHYGFRSWDDFFTRRLRPGARPIDGAGEPSVIVNACESAPYRIETDVAATDTFWIKNFPYSLRHMLAHDERADAFVGGTVYQALLDGSNYHRWHSPVDGRIVDARIEPGIYYWVEPTASLAMAGFVDAQPYLAQTASRGIIFIEADDPAIGLMCVVPIGMGECSTCELTVAAGDRVAKGDELGMFHFGGSTHCLVFRPGVPLSFDLHDEPIGGTANNIPVNARIATVG